MKVLILSSATGGGHNAAAAAVREELERRGIECSMEEGLRFASEKISRRVCATYMGVATHAPQFFYRLYRAGGAISNPRLKSPVYFANRLYRQKLYDYITQNGFNAVVTTHLFSAEALTSLRRHKKAPFYSVFVATDYTCIPFVEETECDALVIPHEDLRGEFLRRGVPEEKMYCFGIPVGAAFFGHHQTKEEARRALGLPEKLPMYLIMSGSMGFGHAGDLTEQILRRIKDHAQIVILCGKNESLLHELQRRFVQKSNVLPLPFTQQVALYMDAADVLFTKPGGLTTSEAAAKNIPLIHTAPIPGCETKNAEFFSSRGMSVVGTSVEQEAELAVELLQNSEKREAMLRAQREHFHADAAQRICDLLAEYVKS